MSITVKYGHAIPQGFQRSSFINITDAYQLWSSDFVPLATDVQSITVEGKSLVLISQRFINIPFPRTDNVTWRGEMAQFIFEHLEIEQRFITRNPEYDRL